MPQIPSGLLAGAKVAGIIDGTVVTGATLVADGSQGQVLVYDGPAANGNLIGSWSGMAIQDPYGNTIPLGLGLQGSGDVLTVTGMSGQNVIVEINPSTGVPELQMSTGAAEEAAAANIEAFITNPGASEAMTLFIYGPQGSTHVSQTGIFLNSATKSGSFEAGANLVYFDESAVEHVLLGWGSGGITVASLIPNDTNVYQTERVTTTLHGTPVTINTTNFSQQIMGTLSLGAGEYHVHGQILVDPNQAAGQAEFEFGGGSAVATMRIKFTEFTMPAGGGGATLGQAADITAFASAFTGATFGAGERWYVFDGTVVCTTAGSWGMFAATTNASDTYVIRGDGTYLELNPVGQ